MKNREVCNTQKIVLLGAASAGKTSLVFRFAHDRFLPNSESTIGAAFVTKSIIINNNEVKLEIWDTGGSEKYRSLAPMYYRDAAAAIIVFDVTTETSLDDAASWLDELKKNGPQEVFLALAANKTDLASIRKISSETIQDFANKNGIKIVYETSALTGSNVIQLFEDVTKQVDKFMAENPTLKRPSKEVLDLLQGDDTPTKKSSCC